MTVNNLWTPKGTCFFCGREFKYRSVDKQAASTKEHIIPRWLLKYLKIETLPVMPITVRTSDHTTISARNPHPFKAFEAGGVCFGCNSGWMSRLEVEVQTILIALIEESRSFDSLSEEECRILSRWALKTAASLNRSSSYGDPNFEHNRRVPDRHLRSLVDGTMFNPRIDVDVLTHDWSVKRPRPALLCTSQSAKGWRYEYLDSCILLRRRPFSTDPLTFERQVPFGPQHQPEQCPRWPRQSPPQREPSLRLLKRFPKWPGLSRQ